MSDEDISNDAMLWLQPVAEKVSVADAIEGIDRVIDFINSMADNQPHGRRQRDHDRTVSTARHAEMIVRLLAAKHHLQGLRE